MEFYLLYEGKLTKSGGPSQKQQIRRQLHPQLVQLWNTHPALLWMKEHKISVLGNGFPESVHPGNIFEGGSALVSLEEFADWFRLGGFRFVPLICKAFLTTCSLEILFLRRDDPGALVDQSGDIDNRIKTLFDGLRMPVEGEVIAGQQPRGPEENPFYCLLEDDSLITDFKVTAGRLLAPSVLDSHSENEVHLVIHVKVNVVRPIPLNMLFV